jgi:NAD(P)-dependent dehydrogenase (short-subunit alcohol dehydrogenase family)
MTDKKVWFITGAGRGMGVDIAKAALAAGHAVVATARKAESVTAALGEHDDLLAVKLDVTDPAAAVAAVQAAVDRFGRIDVLVNNAGNFYAGFFEEISPEDFRAQVETTLFGPVNVARAALPVMRAQRSGLVVAISSTAGLAGGEFLTAYAASKFGLEGWIESLAPEVAPFGIRTMLVEPGFFRTELLTPESTNYAESTIEDYAETHRADRRCLERHERPAAR